ncbi:MAG: hypothetical protein ACRD0Q_08950, partial [Acidimicrobiales bacterium]
RPSASDGVIVLDAGALVALDRDDAAIWARLKTAAEAELPVLIPVAALAQAWRGGPRQARLARALHYLDRVSFDELACAAGELCGRSGTDDVVDASVALVAARPGVTHVYTSDEGDIARLLEVQRVKRRVIGC